MTTTEFDQIFEDMSAPEYPATCDECGVEGTNQTMENHDCNQPTTGAGNYRTFKHRFEPLLNDSTTCRYCERSPTDSLHSNVPEWAVNDQTGQCDACAAIVPRDELRTGMPAAGVEGTFCAKCRGEQPEQVPDNQTTPLPWRVLDGAILSDVINGYGNFVIADRNRKRTAQDEANLKLIATAVNSHAQLVAALERVRKMSQYIVDMADGTNIAFARNQARQVIVEANDALSRVRE